MGADTEFWKKQYSHLWGKGNDREAVVKQLLEENGFTVIKFGFMAGSTEYSRASPDEKGKPDYKIVGNNGKEIILLEVTGTDVKSVKESSPIWIRPDKFQFASNHPEYECWFGHVLDNLKIIRFSELKDGDLFNTVHPRIRDVTETYKAIPPDKAFLESKGHHLYTPEEFIAYLKTVLNNP